MKRKIIIVDNGFASLFLVQYFLLMPLFPLFVWFFRRIYYRYEITLLDRREGDLSAIMVLDGKRDKP